MLRQFINSLLWLSAIGAMLMAYTVLVEPSRLITRQVEFVSDKYSGPQIRIALVTDIHINSLHVPSSRVVNIVEAINAQRPDIVLLPGDFVAGHNRADRRSQAFNDIVERGLSYLGELSAPSFATIGNHDAWWDAARVTQNLIDAGITVLENEAVQAGRFCLVGLSDYMTAMPNQSAYDRCPENMLTLVFTHSPDAWQSFRSDTVLALAGHTHGGQVNLPLIGRRVNAVSLGAEHSYGFSKIAGVDMFVSAGVGTSILPIRFRAPPEIVILTLKAQG